MHPSYSLHPHPVVYDVPNTLVNYASYYPDQSSEYPSAPSQNLLSRKHHNVPGAMDVEMGGTKLAKTKEPKVGRPPNKFMIYRCDKQKEVARNNPTLNQKYISQLIGKMWVNEAKEIKEHYTRLADIGRREHKKRHPNYRYNPRCYKKKYALMPTGALVDPLNSSSVHSRGAHGYLYNGDSMTSAFYPAPAYTIPSMASTPPPSADLKRPSPAVDHSSYTITQPLTLLPPGISPSSAVQTGIGNSDAGSLFTNVDPANVVRQSLANPGPISDTPSDWLGVQTATHGSQPCVESLQGMTVFDREYNLFVSQWDYHIVKRGDKKSQIPSIMPGENDRSIHKNPEGLQYAVDGALSQLHQH
ncbi:hypothetical protein IWQ60_004820 [Tieghemiomyces parasiticus]|uniref:HMG box domain-containing protein n=1 Tax=Tieghemiomyces parasiticus TaxID=78921 RepID=A0A9W8A847_9FUNG|nr:hypothetical protein IWQ60_004820 [Tieghemiomyces parasiticus]